MTTGPQNPAPDRPGFTRPHLTRPEFTWDVVRLRLTWANQPGIRFWGEDSLLDLTERVFSPGDETVRALAVREAEMAEGARVARMTLYPQGDPVWALAECWADKRADGRALMWVGLDDIEAVNDRTLVRKRAGFDAAPRPMVIFDHVGCALVRNEADRRAYPAADGNIDTRYAEPGAGTRALARALAEGAFSHTAMIHAVPVALRHRISLRRMRDPATGNVCVIADFTDLSDRPTVAENVGLKAQRQGGGATVSAEALARIAHDIRAPLSAISGFAEMLRVMGDAMPIERRADALQDIAAASERLSAMADRIIALGSGAGAGQVSVVDLAATCTAAARLFAVEAEANGIILNVDVAMGPKVVADTNAVSRILDNLIRNALTHGSHDGGTVAISVGGGRGGAAPWVEVADDGPGCLADEFSDVLEAYRASAAGGQARIAPKLHGLGISNVMALAADMAATVAIETAPGRGFAVRVTFAVENAG